ncbi:MAG: hypothetical protein HQ517_11945, partial [SAR324 cluster bacterium]|nr:hypothetical protein [SAR324 cluster bacterium]
DVDNIFATEFVFQIGKQFQHVIVTFQYLLKFLKLMPKFNKSGSAFFWQKPQYFLEDHVLDERLTQDLP